MHRTGFFRIRKFDPSLDMFTVEIGDKNCLLTYTNMVKLNKTLRQNLTKKEKRFIPAFDYMFKNVLESDLNPWTIGTIDDYGVSVKNVVLIYNKDVKIWRVNTYAETGDIVYRMQKDHFDGVNYVKMTYMIDPETLIDQCAPDRITNEQDLIINDYQKFYLGFWSKKLKDNYESETLNKVLKIENLVDCFLDDLDGVKPEREPKEPKVKLTKSGKLTKATIELCKPLTDDLATLGAEPQERQTWRVRKNLCTLEEVQESFIKGELVFYTEEEILKMRELNDKMYPELEA